MIGDPAGLPNLGGATARAWDRMLFNSYAFIFGFMPLTLLLFHSLRGAGLARSSIGLLSLMSLLFYEWWNRRRSLLMASPPDPQTVKRLGEQMSTDTPLGTGAMFFSVAIPHSIVGGSAWEPTACRAVQRAGGIFSGQPAGASPSASSA